jgi:hypothetical protein
MNSLGILLIALVALYIAESGVWIPPGSVGFRAIFLLGRRLKLSAPPKRSSSVCFVYPPPVRSAVFISSPFPFFLSPDGVAIRSSGGNADMSDEFIAFANLVKVETAERKLILNGQHQFLLASKFEALAFAELINRIRELPQNERQEAVSQGIASRMDPVAADSKVAAFEDKTETLAALCGSLFFLVFVLLPVVVWRWGISRTWLQILVCVGLHVVLIAFFFLRSNAALEGEADLTQLGTILLSPVSALHATKPLALLTSAGLDPAAIAAARDSDEDFRLLASAAIRDLKFEYGENSAPNHEFRICAQWFRDSYLDRLEVLAVALGLNPRELNLPPKRDSPMSQAYCPRCHAQYARRAGNCSDCESVALSPFDE